MVCSALRGVSGMTSFRALGAADSVGVVDSVARMGDCSIGEISAAAEFVSRESTTAGSALGAEVRSEAASTCPVLIGGAAASSVNELTPNQASVSRATTAADKPSARGVIEGVGGADGGSVEILTRITKRDRFGTLASDGIVSDIAFDSCACTTLARSLGRRTFVNSYRANVQPSERDCDAESFRSRRKLHQDSVTRKNFKVCESA